MSDTPPSAPGWSGGESADRATGSQPPPPGSSGDSPAPPPPGGGPPPPPASQPVHSGGPGDYDVMKAFSYGWDKFTDNLGPILLGMLVLLVGGIVIGVLWAVGVAAVAGSGGTDSGLVAGGIGVASILLFLVYFLLVFLVQAAVIRAALAIVDGREVELGTLLRLDQLGTVVLASLLVAVAAAVGSIVVIGGIVVAFLAQFALFFVLDEGEGAVDSIGSSVRLVIDNFVPVLLLYVGVLLVTAVGALLCGVGLLAAFPVAMIATAYTFRVLRSHPVSP